MPSQSSSKPQRKHRRQSSPIGLPQPKKQREGNTPKQMFHKDIRRLGTCLSEPAFKHDDAQEITQPLLDFQNFLYELQDVIEPSAEFSHALHAILKSVTDYKGMLSQAIFHQKKVPNAEHTGRDVWPFTPRSMYGPMCDFARLLQSTLDCDEDWRLTRMKLACQRLQRKKEEHRKLLDETKIIDDRLKSLVRKHRAQVRLLLARNIITLDRPVEELSVEKLQELVKEHIDELNCQVYSLEDLHCNHNCETCKKNTSKKLGKYQPPPDGSGRPQIPGLFPKGPVSVEDVEEHNFRYVTGGTTCGMMRSPDKDEQEIALFIWSPNYFEETPERRVRLERLAYLIWLGARYSSLCTTNGPQQAVPSHLRGRMGVAGQRKDYSTRIPWGPYAIPARFRGVERKEYVDFQKEYLPELATIFNMLFVDSIGGLVAKSTQKFVAQFNLPPLDAITIHEVNWNDALGCNITFSWDCFSNECHLDKDKYRYVFSAYVFVDKETGDLVTDTDRIANYMKGGYLIWPDLHLALKIVDCTGVVLLFWRGTHERHCTITSEILDDGIVRYGTSIQVNKRLFDSVQRYHKSLENLETWELNGGMGPCPDVPELPTDLGDLSVGQN